MARSTHPVLSINRLKQHQRGAAAIEAALMFSLFFGLFYAIVSYSLPMLMIQAFNHAAASGARAALAVDPNADFSESVDPNYLTAVQRRARLVVGESLNWLPTSIAEQVLGNQNDKVIVSPPTPMDGVTVLTVEVIYENYRDNPIIPTLRLPGIGDVPRLPQDLRGRATVSL